MKGDKMGTILNRSSKDVWITEGNKRALLQAGTNTDDLNFNADGLLIDNNTKVYLQEQFGGERLVETGIIRVCNFGSLSIFNNTRNAGKFSQEVVPLEAVISFFGWWSCRCALTRFSASHFTGEPLIADVEFVGALEKINKYAAANKVEIYIVSSFREEKALVSGAKVTPAEKSNHLVGHAIDMNIDFAGKRYTFDALKPSNLKNLPVEVQNFIQNIRNDPGLRWGGDFKDENGNPDPDPVHIDDNLNGRDSKVWETRLRATQEARKAGCN
jgi:hypothetical protein